MQVGASLLHNGNKIMHFRDIFKDYQGNTDSHMGQSIMEKEMQTKCIFISVYSPANTLSFSITLL